MENKEIPVCTLFSEEPQSDKPKVDSTSGAITTPQVFGTSEVQNAPTSPEVCSLFQDTQSEDLFASIQQQGDVTGTSQLEKLSDASAGSKQVTSVGVTDTSSNDKIEENIILEKLHEGDNNKFQATSSNDKTGENSNLEKHEHEHVDSFEAIVQGQTELAKNEKAASDLLSVEASELSMSDHDIEEDTNNNLNVVAPEANDMMTSIMIHDEDSFENISNLSLNQSIKEEITTDTTEQDVETIEIENTKSMQENSEAQKNADNQFEQETVHMESVESPNSNTVAVSSESNAAPTENAPLASTLFSSSTSVNPFDNIHPGHPSANTADDAFTNALTSSEFDRRKDAWIPSESTQAVLAAVAQSQKRITLESSHLVRPGLGTSESQGDPIKAVLARYKGNEFIERNTISVESVAQDKQGLKELIDTGNLRAAVDLSGKVLTNLGQGFGKQTQESLHTPESLQWWSVRLSLLVRLKAMELVENEISMFGDFDSADLYYGFYPDLYPGRQGSMVPFSLRLLYAEFPKHMNKPGESIARLHAMMDVCDQILDNLSKGKTELGAAAKLKQEDRDASQALWKERKVTILYAIGNSLIQFHEYQAAIKTFDDIIRLKPSDKISLQSGIGRAFLQLGDIKSAQLRFAEVEKEVGKDSNHMLQLYMNRGFLYLGANKWDEALQQFGEALKIAPHNLEALNNKAVCLLYLCRLKDAIATLESAINISSESNVEAQGMTTQHQPITFEGALNNLVTLYELESTRSFAKKQMLLQQMALTVGDGFDVSCLKM